MIFALRHHIQTRPESHLAFSPVAYRELFPGDKVAGAWSLLLTSIWCRIKNTWGSACMFNVNVIFNAFLYHSPNYVFEWLAILLRIREVIGSNLGPSCHECLCHPSGIFSDVLTKILHAFKISPMRTTYMPLPFRPLWFKFNSNICLTCWLNSCRDTVCNDKQQQTLRKTRNSRVTLPPWNISHIVVLYLLAGIAQSV